MKINIFGSTGIIGSKTLKILKNFYPRIKIHLLFANNNVSKLIEQSYKYSPKYVCINNEQKISILKNKINPDTKILRSNDLSFFLKQTKSDYSLLAISGYHSLDFFDLILKNTSSLGLVSKEAIVSGGHLFKKYSKSLRKKIYPLDSEHFSIFKFFNNSNNNKFKKILLTASGGPFLGKKFKSLSDVSFQEASKHPKWKMGYKNSIDSATMVNKCLELVEAHYLFDIPFEKLDVVIHPESLIHSIIELENYFYQFLAFQNDMAIPIHNFLNNFEQNQFDIKNYQITNNFKLNFKSVNYNEFPILKLFYQLNKSNPSNLIKFNIANEYAVQLFKQNLINYTDIYKIIDKIVSLNLNYKLNNIKDILKYHEFLEIKINELKLL